MTAERPENQKFSPAAPDLHCFWGCANWISIIDLLIRLAAETGTMRILRGEGGVEVGLDLIPSGKKNPKSRRNKENRRFFGK